MALERFSFIFSAFLTLVSLCRAQIQITLPGDSFDNSLSAACISALGTTIDCDRTFTYYPNSDYQGPFENVTAQNQFCSQTCSSSLKSYHDSVTVACKDQPDPYEGIPAVYGGDRLWAYQNRTCLKDPATGDFCNNIIAEWSATLPDYDITLDQIPKQYLCSDCYLSLLKAIQSTPYSNYDENMAESYASAQKICGVKFPTEVQPWPANATAYRPPGTGEPLNNETVETTCFSGKTIAVKSGDNCQALSQVNSVSTGALRAINGIFPDCSNLIAGADLCLPQTCQTYQVQSGDTCASIVGTSGTQISDLISYNPTLNDECSNLIAGEILCISPPAGTYTPTTISNVVATQTGQFATTTASPPGSRASGTTTKCGRWYQVKDGDTCEKVSLAQTIALSLFKQINPSIDADCHNLLLGVYYCTLPTSDWNVDSTPTTQTTTQAPPGPTASGTIDSCYTWYTIRSGDGCYLVEETHSITDAQFRAWNPSIDDNCYNLILGNAYCVGAAAPSSSSSVLKTTSG